MRPFAAVLFGLLVSCAHTLEGPCPHIERVVNFGTADTALVVSTAPSQLRVVGSDFEILPDTVRSGEAQVPEAFLELGDVSFSVDVVYISDTELRLEIPVSQPPLAGGLYDLVIVNPSGCDDVLKQSVTVQDSPFDASIVVSEVIPPFGWTQEATAVTIRGSGFASTPRAWLSGGELLRDWELEQVAFIDPTSLNAVVPAEIPIGLYDLILENPNLGYNLLEDAFTVTEDPPPDIFTVLPEAGETQQDTPVVITGADFDPGVEVWLYDIDGTQVQATVDAASPTEIQATFPTSGALSVGAWIVRAVNEDATWDEYAAFVVRNPSAKLGTDGAWAESEPLNIPRVGLGLARHIDELGRGFVYAIAGSDGTTPLRSVERAATDAFGTLAPWEVLGTQLTTPRAHAGFAELDGWVYAIGGDDGAGPVDTVERARILTGDSDHRPELRIPVVRPGEGTLEVGTWYYRVSAVMRPTDTENPGGETPASGSLVVRVEDEPSSIEIGWLSVLGADSYNVYRTDLVNGAAGQEHRIAEGVSSTGLIDDGLPAGTESYVPEGALGAWAELPARLPGPWAHGALVQAQDPAGATFVYLVGGTDGVGALADIYALRSNGTWFTAGTLATPRIDNMAAVAGFDQAQNLGAGSPTWLVALEGDDGGGATNDVVFAEVEAGGTLGAWAGLNSLNAGGQARVDGVGLAAAGHLYILGGGGDASSAESGARQSEIQGPVMDMGSWSSSSNTGSFAVERADFGLTQLRATLYAVGGRTGGENATTSVEQVVF